MVFSSILFLFIFLPLFLLLYHLTPVRFRNLTALLASVAFYAWGAPRFLFAVLAVAGFDFTVGNRIHASNNPRARRGWLIASLVLNLGLLGFFKYSNFAVHELNGLLTGLHLATCRWTHIALPLGISFFTFHKISYIVDVYRRVAVPPRRFTTYLLYLLFFPQLIAGPIIRYHDIADQLVQRNHTLAGFIDGICRFCFGLGKKVLIANYLGETADTVFNSNLTAIPCSYAWIGVLAYSFQIYFDFSGYSDMAIGLARMAGLNFPENFNQPYSARDFTDFWRRWHLSLTAFMREYLYISLGGNRVAGWRSYRNLWIVFLLSGLWHGAAWQFIVWGAYHGFFLTLERLTKRQLSSRIPGVLGIPATFLLITIGWVFFRADDLHAAISMLARMLGATQASGLIPTWAGILSRRAEAMLFLAAAMSFFPALPGIPAFTIRLPLRYACALSTFLLSVFALANATFNPFIYFRF